MPHTNTETEQSWQVRIPTILNAADFNACMFMICYTEVDGCRCLSHLAEYTEINPLDNSTTPIRCYFSNCSSDNV